MTSILAVTVAACAVAFGPVMLMAAVLWWPEPREQRHAR